MSNTTGGGGSWSEQRRRNIAKTRQLQQELFGTQDFASYTVEKLTPSQQETESYYHPSSHRRGRKRRIQEVSTTTRNAAGRQPRRRAPGADHRIDGARKSARLQGKEASLKDENFDLDQVLKGYTEKREPGAAATRKKETAPHVPPVDSSKNLEADVEKLNANWLGHFVNMELGGPGKQAKRAVMNLASASGKKPRFNKMSGIQEFNNAILLFVNIDMTTKYNNVFRDNGRYMTWFAQPTQHEHTPVIQRLLNISTSNDRKNRESASFDRICLFIRLPERPYLYLGELRYVSHDPATRPLMFVWELVHRHNLYKQEHLLDIFES
eukprot:gb/GECG01015063.1/.p1 GENE.gb/GECG01015063.1/~~gb/GECG01015063.1/.p1  ORF type:complete len:324 (+),score=37.07 gb/GECG01015063.1/:1-972(+)